MGSWGRRRFFKVARGWMSPNPASNLPISRCAALDRPAALLRYSCECTTASGLPIVCAAVGAGRSVWGCRPTGSTVAASRRRGVVGTRGARTCTRCRDRGTHLRRGGPRAPRSLRHGPSRPCHLRFGPHGSDFTGRSAPAHRGTRGATRSYTPPLHGSGDPGWTPAPWRSDIRPTSGIDHRIVSSHRPRISPRRCPWCRPSPPCLRCAESVWRYFRDPTCWAEERAYTVRTGVAGRASVGSRFWRDAVATPGEPDI